MNNELYLRWTNLHNDYNSKKNLSNNLYDSWNRSYKANINPHNSKPDICSTDQFSKIKDESKSLYIHANYVLEKMVEYLGQSCFGFALFGKDGCLLKLYGSKNFHEWAAENKLEKQSIWKENIMGTNAISLGLRLRKPISVVGEEHFSKYAINMAVYFSPVIVEEYINQEKAYGGIAIIGPSNQRNFSFLLTAISISREICLQLFWFKSLSVFTDVIDGYGFIAIDQSNNKNHILYSNSNISKILNIPKKYLYYHVLEEIIDQPPKNMEFWNVIKNKKVISDTNMKLSVLKKEIQVSVSTRPFYEKKFHIKGISLIINSTERISSLISKHTGNNARFTFSHIIGKSENYIDVLNHSKAAALWDSNILLLGESGVGKDIIAQAIHNASPRKDKSFIAINCAALPKDLIASELFGYDEGAFTGAKQGGNIGKFELANGGTIFLDEIGDMPLDLQATLLRVIEQKSFMRIGSSISTNTNARIIAATNTNLIEKMRQKEFREDLFYRLGVIRVNIPPLRERKEDILLLTEHFIKIICNRVNKPLVNLSYEVKEFFINYHWPGNVRELQNLLEGIIQIYNDPIITYKHIKNYIDSGVKSENDLLNRFAITNNINEPSILSNSDLDIRKPNMKSYRTNYKKIIIQALELNNNNKTKAAKHLGISRRTLYRRLKEYNLL